MKTRLLFHSDLQNGRKASNTFICASAITFDDRKKATLLHIIDPEAQEIFETLSPVNESYESALNALDQHFSVLKNIPFERSVSINANNDMENHLNSMSHA